MSRITRIFELKPGTAADKYAYLPPGAELRCVPVAPVFQCESCRGLIGSLMSQIRTPSSFGLFGSAPQASDDFSSAVTMMLSWSVIWMVQVLPGPGTVFTNFGSFGSVTSTMLKPECHRCPK